MTPTVFSIDTLEALEPALDTACRDRSAPTLAIVFSDRRHDAATIGRRFAARGIQVFGACASGEFTQEGVSDGQIAVMLLDMDPKAFRLELFDGGESHVNRLGQQVAGWAAGWCRAPALMVMSTGLEANGEAFVNGILNAVQGRIPLFGGIAGIERNTPAHNVFNDRQVQNQGVIALAFDTRLVSVQGVAVSGWQGVGTPKTITKAHGNIVYRIDDAPALDMYNKYLNIGDDPSLAYEYPLLLMRGNGSYILRGLIRINADKSIAFGGPVPEGVRVRFSMAPGLEIIDHAVANVSQLTEKAPTADAVILFSCQGRKFTLGPMVEDEIDAIHRLWDTPLIGFFTNGEIGPMPQGRCELHNHTLVPVVLRER